MATRVRRTRTRREEEELARNSERHGTVLWPLLVNEKHSECFYIAKVILVSLCFVDGLFVLTGQGVHSPRSSFFSAREDADGKDRHFSFKLRKHTPSVL